MAAILAQRCQNGIAIAQVARLACGVLPDSPTDDPARRTSEMLAALQGQDAELVDPASAREQQPGYARNPARSIKPEIFVAVGICTHLGRSPSAVPIGSAKPGVGEHWQGGFFCPCHGSTFDGAGVA